MLLDAQLSASTKGLFEPTINNYPRLYLGYFDRSMCTVISLGKPGVGIRHKTKKQNFTYSSSDRAVGFPRALPSVLTYVWTGNSNLNPSQC